ncbi:hypothetical protein [Geoalkalibacter halelectricus]|uniref:Uncharacterized protein n=1 Tax=Geoalkalibacter halelectricus TaxID=2847045 RepID=A0ABY5ZNN4_9BACT|nr:hypothetical protein [Geoalkalibacter halelectricus]MDO3377177.1 hypothetical protein [Geoalkalibacter halelectricus]UWZ79465.1 hypothetical protein L9S41_17540 [Geoalkalibacter halelectricus]
MPSPIRNTIAFWIAPTGEIHLVEDTHIHYVIDHPELFQISLEELRRRYETHNEEWGSEGQARGETIRELVAGGWIRIRRYPEVYSVNVRDFDGRSRKHLAVFAAKLLKDGFDGRYERDRHLELRIRALGAGKAAPVRLVELQRMAQEA